MYLMLDTETTGLNPLEGDQIIDIHAILTDKDGKVQDYYGSKVLPAPGVLVHPKAAEVNGYPDGWQTAISLDRAIDEFNMKFKGLDLQLVGWNPSFDMSFLRAGGWIRSFKLAYHPIDVYSLLLPHLKDCPAEAGRKYPTLGAAFKHLTPQYDLPKMHSAVGDAMACVTLFKFAMSRC